MSLTSSVTGTAQNVSFARSSNNRTFFSLAGADGGTDAFGLQDADYIRFVDTDDIGATSFLEFQIDTGTSTPETEVTNYRWSIGIQDLTESADNGADDVTRSRTAWNRLSYSIKAHTQFGYITIEEFVSPSDVTDGEHHAIFHITSSNTGSIYDTDISSVYNASGIR